MYRKRTVSSGVKFNIVLKERLINFRQECLIHKFTPTRKLIFTKCKNTKGKEMSIFFFKQVETFAYRLRANIWLVFCTEKKWIMITGMFTYMNDLCVDILYVSRKQKYINFTLCSKCHRNKISCQNVNQPATTTWTCEYWCVL
jgi:hypothetical protein